jgi:DNA sulfur modification protein DndB
MPEWQAVRDKKITAGDVRQDFIHSHGIVLHALGNVGNVLLRDEPSAWKKRLKKLSQINWSRLNSKQWEGRAMIGGRICKAGHNVTLTTNAIKTKLDIPLTAEEQRVENAFLRGDDVATAAQ